MVLREVTGTRGWLFIASVIVVVAVGCGRPAGEYRAEGADPELLHASVDALTQVMIRDIFSPPQASRAYAYASIAAYEALAPGHPRYASLAGQLNGLRPVPRPAAGEAPFLPLASLHAFMTVATEMVYSTGAMERAHDELLQRFRSMGVSDDAYRRSLAYGDEVARHVVEWARADGYAQLHTMPGFSVTGEPGRWKPTPPAYMDGVGANWNRLRPFVLDSAAQFKPQPPPRFSLEETSPFFREVRHVYDVGRELTPEQREIAAFWDCNPYVMHTQGHAMFATKQMSPGGHWLGIAAIASRTSGADLMRTAETYARVAVAVADGFVSAFDEKYRSALIRPETVINEHIDPSWRPVLQTPPFPEYTSAHSVISAAAATVLADLYGRTFAFEDTSEEPYGLPARSFQSFVDAAREAAESRVFGGIHYRVAADRGLEQGEQLGHHVVVSLRTRDTTALASVH